MAIIPIEDINYLAKQSSGNINMILSGMTALMNDTDNKVETMESQGWFKRMVKTVSGKNKLTQDEIRKNHDKLNAYMSEAIAELYNRNCIDEKVMMSLGTQLNELYADHVQLKQMLGAFVSKLNEKIDSVDNFHMLTTEINQGVYSFDAPIFSICKIISQFDKRILEDSRKLDIIRRSMVSQNIINNNPVILTDYLNHILQIPVEEIGQIYLELGTIKDNFVSKVILGMIEEYHFLPDMARKMKDKDSLIEKVIDNEELDGTIELSISDIYDDFINTKLEVNNSLLPVTNIQLNSISEDTSKIESNLSWKEISDTHVDLRLEKAEKLYLEYKLDEAFRLFKALSEEGNGRAMYFMGEYYAFGYGCIEKDSEQAKKWRIRGRDKGDVLSSLNVAFSLLEEYQEVDDVFSKIFESVLELAENGDVFAQNELYDLYRYGFGTTEDTHKAFRWLKKSANSGFWKSIDELGDIYIKGEIVAQDYSEAVEYYKKGANLESVYSQYMLGICYYLGKGVEQDTLKGMKLLKKAYENGCMDAADLIGYYYYHGYGVSKNYNLAKQWYIKAANGGSDESSIEVGKMEMNESNYSEAVKWYIKASENGYADAQNRLGIRYYKGEGIELDRVEAFKWFMKAAEQGHIKAQTNVGICYHFGRGIVADNEKSKEWLRKASNEGYDPATCYLNKLYKEGNSNISNSIIKDMYEDAYESIESLCENFIKCHDTSQYDVSYKLKCGLDINNCKKIYLAHDDTWFKSGKNGFAITSEGIFYRGVFDSNIYNTTFEELAKVSKIYIKDSFICADNNILACYTSTNSDSVKSDLLDLFLSIKRLVNFDY